MGKEKLLRPKPELKFPPIPTYPPPPKCKHKKVGGSGGLLTAPITPMTPATPLTTPTKRSHFTTTPSVQFEPSRSTLFSPSSEWSLNPNSDNDEETDQEPPLLPQYRTPHYTTLKLVVQHLGWKLRRHQKALQQWKIMKDDMLEKHTKMSAAGMDVPPTVDPPKRPHMSVVLPYTDVLRLVLRGLEATAVDYSVGKNSLLLHNCRQKK